MRIDIDAEDFAWGVVLTVVFGIVAIMYFGIGAVLADLMSLHGFAWYAMTMAWPVMIFVLWVLIASLFAILRG